VEKMVEKKGVCSIIAGDLGGLSFAGGVQGVGGSVTLLGSLLTLHVQGDSGRDVRLGANRIHGLLHLAVTALASFHGIGRK
jgi:hypothetical protein